jgi:hypothetical protein
VKQKDIRRLKSEEMKFIRHTTGYSLLDHRRNEHILGMKADLVKKKPTRYKNG